MFSPFVGLMIIFFTALCKYFKILTTLCHFYIDIVCMVQHRVIQDWPRKGKKLIIKVIYDIRSGGSKAFPANFSMWIQLVWIFRGGGVSWSPNPPSDPRMGSMQYNAFCTLRFIIVYQLLLTEFLNCMQFVYNWFYKFSM